MTKLFGVRRRDKLSDAPEIPGAPTRRGWATRVLAGIATGALLAGLAATPATAAPEEEPAAYSSGWVANPGTISVNTQVTGAVGWLLGPIVNPVLNQLVGPLVGGIANLPSRLVGPLLGVVFGNGLEATSPATGAPVSPAVFPLAEGTSPSHGSPASCTASSNTCYHSWAGMLLDGVGGIASPLVDLNIGLVHGLTEPVASATGTDIVAQSQITGIGLDVLGLIRVLDADGIQSTSQCAVDGSSSRSNLAGVGVLGAVGGPTLIEVEIAEGDDGDLLSARLLGIPITAAGITDATVLGLVTASLDGNLLKVRVGIGLGSLLNSLGLGALGGLISNLADLEVGLHITVGPGTSVSAAGNSAGWGLGVGLGISIDLHLNVIGLVGLQLNVGGAGAAEDSLGNLFDLRLAYTNCSTTGSLPETGTWISPGRT